MNENHEHRANLDADLEGLLQQALRASTPEALSSAQRASLESALNPARAWRKRMAVFAMACALPLAIYLVIQERRHAQLEAEAALRRAEAVAVERARELAAREEVNRLMLERAKLEKARLEAEQDRAAAAAAAAKPCAMPSSGRARTRPDNAAAKGAASSKPSSSKAEGCDPNDPLCGL